MSAPFIPPTVGNEIDSFGQPSSFVYRGTGERFNPAEYLICQQRGHESSGHAVTEGMGPTWTYCKWCGCKFRFTDPECVEHPHDVVTFEQHPISGDSRHGA